LRGTFPWRLRRRWQALRAAGVLELIKAIRLTVMMNRNLAGKRHFVQATALNILDRIRWRYSLYGNFETFDDALMSFTFGVLDCRKAIVVTPVRASPCCNKLIYNAQMTISSCPH
jgi:hypothetical protein